MSNQRKCDSCGVPHKEREEYKNLMDVPQWWFFRGYTTAKGNVYNGFFCDQCSDAVYAENKCDVDHKRKSRRD